MLAMPVCVALALLALSAVANDAVNCNVGGYDLSQIPTAQLTINQQYGSEKLTPYTWVINVCQMVNLPPGAASNCKDSSGNQLAGYISEYSSKSCETTWNQLVSTSSGANSVTLNLGQQGGANHLGWTATVALTCAAGPLDLASSGNVVVTGASTSALNFAFSLTTSAVCGGGPPPATPTPGAPPVTPTPGVPPVTPTPGAPVTPAPTQSGTQPVETTTGCGGGCGFVIIVFVGGFVYVAATVAWYYFRQGKRGTELVPHTDFWKEFGLCVKEGVIFSVQKIRGLACKSGPYADTGYTAV